MLYDGIDRDALSEEAQNFTFDVHCSPHCRLLTISWRIVSRNLLRQLNIYRGYIHFRHRAGSIEVQVDFFPGRPTNASSAAHSLTAFFPLECSSRHLNQLHTALSRVAWVPFARVIYPSFSKFVKPFPSSSAQHQFAPASIPHQLPLPPHSTPPLPPIQRLSLITGLPTIPAFQNQYCFCSAQRNTNP
jgi:hypothetical protein